MFCSLVKQMNDGGLIHHLECAWLHMNANINGIFTFLPCKQLNKKTIFFGIRAQTIMLCACKCCHCNLCKSPQNMFTKSLVLSSTFKCLFRFKINPSENKSIKIQVKLNPNRWVATAALCCFFVTVLHNTLYLNNLTG